MPTILKIDGWRFFFFSDEHTPEHIHIEKADSYARIERGLEWTLQKIEH